jgi:hypothetical protein
LDGSETAAPDSYHGMQLLAIGPTRSKPILVDWDPQDQELVEARFLTIDLPEGGSEASDGESIANSTSDAFRRKRPTPHELLHIVAGKV